MPTKLDYITVIEYAELHGVDPGTVRQKILRGRLPAIKMGQRCWLIHKDQPYIDHRCLESRIKEHRSKPKA